jgi:hypothetical protein
MNLEAANREVYLLLKEDMKVSMTDRGHDISLVSAWMN